MRRRPLILFLALLSVFLWGLPSARAASRWAPSSEKDARQKALDLFCECAFHAEYLLRYLYSSWVSPGMSEKEARTALLPHPDPL